MEQVALAGNNKMGHNIIDSCPYVLCIKGHLILALGWRFNE
jgi:hypothetical protein